MFGWPRRLVERRSPRIHAHKARSRLQLNCRRIDTRGRLSSQRCRISVLMALQDQIAPSPCPCRRWTTPLHVLHPSYLLDSVKGDWAIRSSATLSASLSVTTPCPSRRQVATVKHTYVGIATDGLLDVTSSASSQSTGPILP